MVINFRRLAIFLLFLLFAFVAFPFVLALRAQLCFLLIFCVPVLACHAFNFFFVLCLSSPLIDIFFTRSRQFNKKRLIKSHETQERATVKNSEAQHFAKGLRKASM